MSDLSQLFRKVPKQLPRITSLNDHRIYSLECRELLKAIETLSADPKNINEVNGENGHTLLHIAVTETEDVPCSFVQPNTPKLSSQILDLVQKLVFMGSNIDAVDKNGDTPLHLAVRNPACPATVIEFLLGQGADTSITNKLGETAHYETISYGDFSKSYMFVRMYDGFYGPAGLKYYQTYYDLCVAIVRTNGDITSELKVAHEVDQLTKNGEIPDLNFPKIRGGESPLYFAVNVAGKKILLVERLLRRGADPNPIPGLNRKSVMHKAVTKGNCGLVTTLRKFGGNVKVLDSKGNTTLNRVSATKNNWEMVQSLADSVDANLPNQKGRTALHSACLFSDFKTAWMLVFMSNARMDVRDR